MNDLISSLGVQDYIALGVILLAIFAAIYYTKKNKKKGCSGDCSGCPYAGNCHEKKDTNDGK